MARKSAVFVTARYDEEMLRSWAAAGWISIEESEVGAPLSEADEARCNLICDLKQDIGVNDDGDRCDPQSARPDPWAEAGAARDARPRRSAGELSQSSPRRKSGPIEFLQSGQRLAIRTI